MTLQPLPPASNNSMPSSSETSEAQIEEDQSMSCLTPILWALQDNRPLYSDEPSEPPSVSPSTSSAT